MYEWMQKYLLVCLATWAQGRTPPPMCVQVRLAQALKEKHNLSPGRTEHEPDQHEKPLSAVELTRLVSGASRIGAVWWGLICDGEKPDPARILSVMRSIKDNHMHGYCTINGVPFTESELDWLVVWGWDQIHVTLYGHDAVTHERLSPGNESLEQLLRTVALINKLKKQYHRLHPQISVTLIVNEYNRSDIDKMVRTALAATPGSIVIRDPMKRYVVPKPRIFQKKDEEFAHVFDTAQLIAQRSHINLAIEIQRATALNEYLAEYLKRDLNTNQLYHSFGALPCFDAWFLMNIDYYGMIHCCQAGTIPASRFSYEDDILRTWSGQQFTHLRHDYLSGVFPFCCHVCNQFIDPSVMTSIRTWFKSNNAINAPQKQLVSYHVLR